MALSKEAKTGLLVMISLVIFYLGFNFLKGSNVFSGENEYYAYYNSVQGLQKSAGVQVKGLNVGRVTNIELVAGDSVKVTFSVSKDVEVPVGTTAELASSDLLGSKIILLKLGTGTTLLEDESVMPASVEGGIIDNLSVELSPLIQDVRHVVTTLDTVLVGVSGVLNEQTAKNLSATIVSLDVTMKNLSELSVKLNNESEQLSSIIHNANSITSNLADNNQQITNIIKNAEATTNQLANAPIEQTVKELQSTVEELRSVIGKMNGTNGSLGLMMNDAALYNNLTHSLKTLDALMADINEHPSRYINVTIFGKKRKD